MQVTHTEDHVTHAVIGGAKQIDMGISDSAEFFHILSSTLYSDQKLAVVRETVCNAWDAHIDSNRKDKAITITVSEEAITIRDYGYGIPKDLIGPIYGVYGASTKKNDGNATGGFGLGCKSPFAYTDNFQVTSFCDGVRTIYNMSKSSAVVGGKPSIVPIASFPTTETGLEVVIRLTEKSHRRMFRDLFDRIVWNGGIRATMNGAVMPTLKTYAVKEKFFLTDREVLSKSSQMAISYGNVIYPLDEHSHYAPEYRKAMEVINSATENKASSCTLVLIAPPNSISVTPSRESLSMQTHTLNTAKILLHDFVLNASKVRSNSTLEIVRDSVEQAVKKKLFDKVLNQHASLPNKPAKGRTSAHYGKDFTVFDFDHLSKLHLGYEYPSEHSKFDFKLRISELMKAGHTPAGLGQSFLRAFSKARNNNERRSLWANKHVVWPVLRRMKAVEGMSAERLLVYGVTSRWSRDPQTHKATELGGFPLYRSASLLRNTIVVTYTRKDVEDRLRHSEEMKEFGRDGVGLMYVVPRSQPRVDEALQFFKSHGYRVVNLTQPQKGEHSSVVAPIAVRAPAKTRSVGLPLVTNGTPVGRDSFHASVYWDDSLPRTTDPEYVVLCTNAIDGKLSSKFNEFNREISGLIAKHFGATGGVVRTRVQEATYIKKGAKEIHDFLIPKICTYIQNCPLIYANRAAVLTMPKDIYDGRTTLIERLNASKQALAVLNLAHPLSDVSQDYMTMWRVISQRSHPDIQATDKYLDEIPQSADATTLSQGIEKSEIAHCIDARELVFGLQSKDPNKQNAALKLLQFVIT
jgi:hypothetical protein